jgi:hypothetical protein
MLKPDTQNTSVAPGPPCRIRTAVSSVAFVALTAACAAGAPATTTHLATPELRVRRGGRTRTCAPGFPETSPHLLIRIEFVFEDCRNTTALSDLAASANWALRLG